MTYQDEYRETVDHVDQCPSGYRRQKKVREVWLMAALRIIWGAKNRQIAKILDIHPSTVARRLKSSDAQGELARLRSKYLVTMSNLSFWERMARFRKK